MAQVTSNIGDGNTNCGNITGSFNKTVYKSDEDGRIMSWLSPLEPSDRHQGVRNDRFGGVGDWLLETSEFREWRDGEGGADKAVLFCSGTPGVGKTYLSSLVIDSLCDQAGTEDIAVTGVYCDFLAREDQTTVNMIGAILRQLAGRGDIPNDLREAFGKAKKEFGGRRPQLPELMGMLRVAISSLPKVFICVDALDECLQKHLPALLKSLKDIVHECPGARLFLTGRPHIKDDVRRYFTHAVVMPISPNAGDIRSYVEMRLNEDAVPAAMSDDLRADIIRIIMEKISDIFLLVSLHIDVILGEMTIHRRRTKLEEITQGNGLSDAYAATLARLKAQKGNRPALGLNVLMWVVYSERPLRTKELCHALAVEVGTADLNVENVPALEVLLACCVGLVTVEASSSTVRLVHFTLQEYLSSHKTLFSGPHSNIAEVCLTYLNSRCVLDIPPSVDSALSAMPFLGYAPYHWGKHIGRGVTEKAKTLALGLLDRFEEHICAHLMLLSFGRGGRRGLQYDKVDGLTGFTGLHAVAFLGIVEIADAVFEMKEWDVNAIDCNGNTALSLAAVSGHEEVVKMLLRREGIIPDTTGTECGVTSLSWAIKGRREGVVKTLLERVDVNPNQPEPIYGFTPLLLAAMYGCGEAVKMLVERADVNPNQADNQGRTALSFAVELEHQGIVKMLLERADVNPDQTDTKGRTPLSWAAEGGHEGVVKMLLERADVSPDQADNEYGMTALFWAAMGGYGAVVKLLLERTDVNPSIAATEFGLTPLIAAAGGGHSWVVKMLLGRDDVNPNTADTKFGRTPLSWAAGEGHERVAKMLLERLDVNPNQADTPHGETPLSWAIMCGNEGVVRILLHRNDVNPDQANTHYGHKPLSWAAWCGNEGILKMLLERVDIDPNTADIEYGRTPLSLAAECGHEGVVKMLLERQDVNTEQPDTQYGRTPLSWAAGCGNDGVVKMLLKRKDVTAGALDNRNQTPLSHALANGHDGIVRIILDWVNRNSTVAYPGGLPSIPPPTAYGNEPEVAAQSRGDHPNTNTTELNPQHAPPPADPAKRGWVSDTYPNNTRSILSLPVDRYFLMASFVCLFAFLVYILPSLSEIFPFHR